MGKDIMFIIDAEAMSKIDSKISSMLLSLDNFSSENNFGKHANNYYDNENLEEETSEDEEIDQAPDFLGPQFELVDNLLDLVEKKRDTGKLRSSFRRIRNQSCDVINNVRNEINNAFERKDLVEESNKIHRLRHNFEDVKVPDFSGKGFEIVDGLIVLTEEKRKIRNLQCSFEAMRSNIKRTAQ